ncbi:hypothetical protein JCM11641_008297 [Rhodosporidiobolus odoratus]
MGHNGTTWWRDGYGWYRCVYCSDRDFRTEAAVINLGRYRCVLCNNTFTDLRGLNQHLLSPRHSYGNGAAPGSEDKLYKCPNVACAKKFATLSGLVQHAEAGGCGVMRIRGVQQTFDSVMGGMKRLAL